MQKAVCMGHPLGLKLTSNNWLAGFYGISNILDYLEPNPVFTYLLDIYDL